MNDKLKKTKECFYQCSVYSSVKDGTIISICYKQAVVFRRYNENGFSFFCHKIDEELPFRITEETTGLFVTKGKDFHEVEEKFLTLMKKNTKKDILLRIIQFKKMMEGVERIYG